MIEFSLEDGKSIFVEERGTDEGRSGEIEASFMGGIGDRIKMPFKEAMETVRDATEVVIQQIDNLKKIAELS